MADAPQIHEVKRFCLKPPSSYAAGVLRDKTNNPQLLDSILAESVKHHSNATLSSIARPIPFKTNFAGPSWNPDFGFEMLLRAANHLGGLGQGFPDHSLRQSFEQIPQNGIGPLNPKTSSVILTPDHSEQSYPLNLSKASSDSGSNYSSSPDTDPIDYSVKANPKNLVSRSNSHSLKQSEAKNLSGKDNAITSGSSWTNGSTNATFLNNYHSHLDTIHSFENNAHSSISINSDRNALTSSNITNGGLPTNGNLWTNCNSITNGRSSSKNDSFARSSLKIAPDDSLRNKRSSSNWRSSTIRDIDRFMTNRRTSTSASINGDLWRNGSSTTNGHSPINIDDLSEWSTYKSHGKSNGSPSININAKSPDDIGRSFINGKTLSNGSSSPNQDSSTNLSISRKSWTNGQASTNGYSSISSLNGNGKKKVAIYDPTVASTRKTAKEADAGFINTVPAPIPGQITQRSQYRDPVVDVLNLYLGMDGATASQGRSLDPSDPTVNGILWRVQEAQRLTQLLPDDPTEIDLYPIVDVLERPGVKPDMDETCSISFNQNLARDQGNGPRRSIMGHMDRIVNNDSARSCRIQHTATAAQVSNDVFVQMKRQKQLTKRWSAELTTLNFLQELMGQMGLKCDTDSEDNNDEDDVDQYDEDNDQDYDLNFSDLHGPAVDNIKEEVNSEEEGQ